MKKDLRIKKKKGFTLIELIVVIAILGILAAVLIPRFSGFTDRARTTQVLTNAKQIATAADALFTENNAVPSEADIATMSGVAVTSTNLTNLAATGTTTPITFEYTETVDTISFTATRGADGEITVEKTATP